MAVQIVFVPEHGIDHAFSRVYVELKSYSQRPSSSGSDWVVRLLVVCEMQQHHLAKQAEAKGPSK